MREESLLKLNPALNGRLTLLDEVTSTNTVVKEQLRAGARAPVVIARSQAQGKGRAGRSFASPPGTGLYLTMGAPPLPIPAPPLTALVGCCVVRAIELVSGCQAALKWVNDVLMNEKKVCGILCESVAEGVAIGIGINVNTPCGYFEAANLPHASSVAVESGNGNEVPLDALAAEVAREVDIVLSGVGDTAYVSAQLEFYRSRLVTLGREVSVISAGDSSRRGFAADIDDEARLIVDFPTGREAVDFGDVSVRGIYGYV